jgi:hypothetical protein
MLWDDLDGATGLGLEWFSLAGDEGEDWTGLGERSCLELWLNLEGQGLLELDREPLVFFPRMACLLFSADAVPTMRRAEPGAHVFARAVLSRDFALYSQPMG